MLKKNIIILLFITLSNAFAYQTVTESYIDVNDIVVDAHYTRLADTKNIEPESESDIVKMIEDELYVEAKEPLKIKEKEMLIDDSMIAKNLNSLDKMGQIEALANHISKKYNIPLENAQKIVSTTFEESQKKDLEPALVLSLISTESRFNPNAKSGAGAVGLTQVIPIYHQDKINNLKNNESMSIFSIKGNIKVGTQILREYLNYAGGNLQKALQMYNGNLKDPTKKYSNVILSGMREFKNIK